MDTGEEGLRARLRVLCEKHGQSEVARRTGTSRQNINRYLGGAKAPLGFGVGLVAGLGVNPAWLLTGKGATYLSDVSEGGAMQAGHLVEVVRGMSAVSRMKLGELAGKRRQQVLRELGEALEAFEAHRRKMNEQVAGLLEALIGDLFESVRKGRLERARECEIAATQVARFSLDDAAAIDLEMGRGFLEDALGNIEASLRSTRLVFLRNLAKGVEDESAGASAHNLIVSLHKNGRTVEARRVARAMLELMDGVEMRTDTRYRMMALGANMDLELGELEQCLAMAGVAATHVAPDYRPQARAYVARAQLLSGARRVSDFAPGSPPDPSLGHGLLSFAAWCEDATALRRCFDDFVEAPGARLAPSLPRVAHWRRLLEMLEARPGTRRRLLQRLLPDAMANLRQPRLEQFAGAVERCQLARVAQDASGAQRLAEADEAMSRLEADVTPGLMTRAMHYKNALLLAANSRGGAERELAARARAFFAHLRTRGYRALASPEA